MKAAVYDEPGDPDVLRYVDVPDPPLEADCLLIRVRSIAIEGGDVLNRATTPPPRPTHIVGYAAAGEVIAISKTAGKFKVGDRVTVATREGSHAELLSVPSSQAWHIPDSLDFDRAAAVPIAWGTADHCVRIAARAKSGEVALVQGGAGGVGLAAIQILKREGLRVLATVSGLDRADKLREMGLDQAIDGRLENVTEAVKRLTNGQGVDLTLDAVGSTIDQSIAATRPQGRIVFLGAAGRSGIRPDLWPAMINNQILVGASLGSMFGAAAWHDGVASILQGVAAGQYEVVIAGRFPLREAAAAHRFVERGGSLGRTVMNA